MLNRINVVHGALEDYAVVERAMGELTAWVMGLLLVLEYGLAASTVAVGWSGYVANLLEESLGLHLPADTGASLGAWLQRRAAPEKVRATA